MIRPVGNRSALRLLDCRRKWGRKRGGRVPKRQRSQHKNRDGLFGIPYELPVGSLIGASGAGSDQNHIPPRGNLGLQNVFQRGLEVAKAKRISAHHQLRWFDALAA